MVFHTDTLIVTLFFIITLLPSFSDAHYRLSFPKPRQDRIVYKAPACEHTNTNIPPENVFEAGSWFVPRHGKSNHNGGFDLYSLVPLQARPSIADMIDENNIFHIECQTLNCVTPDFNQGGEFVQDEVSLKNSCWGSGFYWPNTPGEFTMLWYNWATFGSQGREYQQLNVYSNCANIRLTPSNTQSNGIPKCTFGGGNDTLLWDKRRPNDHQCAYKRFKNPPLNAKSTNKAIKDDIGQSQEVLHQGVEIGVPDMVSSGKCAIIAKRVNITNGPWHGNNNKIPPPIKYTYLQ